MKSLKHIGHFEFERKPGSVLCRIVLLDCLGTVIASPIANLVDIHPTRSLKMRLLSKGQFMTKLLKSDARHLDMSSAVDQFY